MPESLNFCVCVVMVVPVLLCFYWLNSQPANQISEIRALLSELQDKIEKTDIKYNELFHHMTKVGNNQQQEIRALLSELQDKIEKTDIKYNELFHHMNKVRENQLQERPSTLSGVKDKDHDERTEIKFDDNKTNKNSYNSDKEGGNDEQKTNVSQDGVKDEEEKVDMEFNKCNTNTQQCNCLDKKEETDNEKILALLSELQDKVKKTNIKYNELFHQMIKGEENEQQERSSTLSGVKDKDHDERTEIKFDDNKTNKNSYNLDKEGGNDELKSNVSRDGVKDEEEKVGMEFNKCNTNTQQCNCLDKKEETDNEKIRSLLSEVQEKIEKTDIKYNQLFHQMNKVGGNEQQERPSTLPGVKDQDHDKRTEIKIDDYKTNKKQSYNLDQEGGNDEQKTHVSRCGVKDEEKKVDMEFNKPSKNTEQCHCLDKEREAKVEDKTVTWWSWIKNLIIHFYGLLTVLNNLGIGVVFLAAIVGGVKK
ncbi:uncharacterized protein LOC128164463 isoform X2 [Crassostrea angulata]|uniref:uncharacterized protein LOC128164463 isoform X2 n=1 Tax=Magallana angulata TaxID=2784310 RepID=UPI0022B1A011|nr:uncharacterized protein LOC128164463 isoform X2 [Crassostrea angulata]